MFVAVPLTSSVGRRRVTLTTCCSSPGVNSFDGRFSSWNALSSNLGPLPSPDMWPLVLATGSPCWTTVVCRWPSTTTAAAGVAVAGGEAVTQTEGKFPLTVMGLLRWKGEAFPLVGISEAASRT